MSQYVTAAFNHAQEAINNLKTEIGLLTKPLSEDATAKQQAAHEAAIKEVTGLKERAVALKKAIGACLLEADD